MGETVEMGTMGTVSGQVLVGIDVGSTTVKAAALLVDAQAGTRQTLATTYRRHHANQLQTAITVLEDLERDLGARAGEGADVPVRLAVTGSAGKQLAEALGVPYVQEVVANAIAVAADYPQARVAIELGGQDAKMIFFEPGTEDGTLKVSDMRMNGSCAGGTGAFLDEIATLLQLPVEELDACAARGTTLYSISGRCGVFAKTDIQPLVNQGAAKEDIALSTFHAVAKQTLGGLAQGLDVMPPVIFEGGPLTFDPTLVRVFKERLGLADEDAIIPANPETIVARGAALYSAVLTNGAQAATPPEGAGNGEKTGGTKLAVAGGTKLAGAEVGQPSASFVPPATLGAYRAKLEELARAGRTLQETGDAPFFATEADKEAFLARHARAEAPAGPAAFTRGQTAQAYLGIDSGSTTTKFALVAPDGALLDAFYASNAGEPLEVAKAAFAELARRWDEAGVELDILGCATTGYGEMLFAKALHADCHVVETVAHALAAARYVDDATFILDIGGQDMKAIWLDGGIVTDILVNEACSSGCGSFLENFAHTLGVPTREIAKAAFRSQSPAQLGSRCTVFMNSSVVTEQRNGKSPDDIMAGLCRSIIKNVFTKVIRVSNLDNLGERIVVQGGTFENDAVLAAFEDYVGRPVTRAPYPGLMGAIGAALFAKRHMDRAAAEFAEDLGVDADPATVALPPRSSFVGLAAAAQLEYTLQANVTCPFCTNNCARSVATFADGSAYVTGNRCERGEVLGDPRDASVREQARAARAARERAANLYDVREKLLMADYPAPELAPARGVVVGLPRVLAFWDTMPFWTTFWRSLGFGVRISRPSTRTMYEDGLPAVASDTVCFPAKLVHGHVRDLERAGVDRIFMPSITTVPSENTEKTSESMCAVVKGYAIVMRNSDNPELRVDAAFDAPLFHWYTDADRARQLGAWMKETFGIGQQLVDAAVKAADAAQASFRAKLLDAGRQVLEQVRREGGYAVVLASRPYHNDPLVNHDLPGMFCTLGIPVLTPDALPGTEAVDLSCSRLDIVNNYHARMLSTAILAAEDPNLEYAQVVSFGCGHDAYLSDEIVRLVHAITDKSPLVLKVDESDVPGPLRIRIRSFVETVNIKRQERHAAPLRALQDPYPVKFTKADRKERVVLIPNTSHAFSRLMAAAFVKQGVRAVPIPIGREEAIRLGKQYVHNDICFPAQITIGECLAELRSGKYDGMDVAVGTGKYIGDCRLTHYGALLRKALDDAGYADVPIVTNDDVDYHDLHPGFRMSVPSAARVAMGLPMIDALEELLRKIRPYELVPGSADEAFERGLDAVMEGLERHGAHGAQRGFRRAIQLMKEVEYDRSEPRPRVLIVGEYLLNFHPGANRDVELYLERNGLEVVEARMTDVIRKTYFYKGAQISEYGVKKPFTEATWYKVANALFEHAHDVCDRIAAAHPLYEPATRMPELVQGSDEIIHHTFDAGEGVLIPGEIVHHADRGCEAFLILQPFGCLPNHIVGRGIVKRLRELYPAAQILSLDYDPDVSFANVENRLQMLVMNVRAAAAEAGEGGAAGAVPVGAGAGGAATVAAADAAADAAAAVDGVLNEVREMVDSALVTAAATQEADVQEGDVARHVDALARSLRADLEREDTLAARAKDALLAARAAARGRADSAGEELVQRALAANDQVRLLRTRTHRALSDMNSFAADLASASGKAAERTRAAFAAHVANTRRSLENLRSRWR